MLPERNRGATEDLFGADKLVHEPANPDARAGHPGPGGNHSGTGDEGGGLAEKQAIGE